MEDNARFSVAELIEFSDTELEQYLEAFCNGQVDPCNDILDIENMPDEFLERIERLGSHKGKSNPVDPVKLTELLQEVRGCTSLPLEATGPSSPPCPKAFFMQVIADETHNLLRLEADGCVPVYPRQMIEQVVMNPDQYHHILCPWMESYCFTTIFDKQLDHWQLFRGWQHSRRHQESLAQSQRESEFYLCTRAVKINFKLRRRPADQSPRLNWIEYLSFLARNFFVLWNEFGREGRKMMEAWEALYGTNSLLDGSTMQDLINEAAPDGVPVDRRRMTQLLLPMNDPVAEWNRHGLLFAFHVHLDNLKLGEVEKGRIWALWNHGLAQLSSLSDARPSNNPQDSDEVSTSSA